MDGDLLDALTGGDGHLDDIKVYVLDDKTYPLNYGPLFVCIAASNQEKIQLYCLNPQILRVNTEVLIRLYTTGLKTAIKFKNSTSVQYRYAVCMGMYFDTI